MELREVSKLKPNPNNPRGEIVVDDSLRELAESIKEHGVLQPILITPDGVIVAGHRRHKACEFLGNRLIPAIERELDETQQIQIMLVENLQRDDLTPLQTARAYQLLMDRGLKIWMVARAIGVAVQMVNSYLAILKLPETLHPHFESGALSLNCARCLLELEPQDREAFGLLAVKKKWGLLRLKAAIHRKLNPQPKRDIIPAVLDRIWERIEDGCYTVESVMRCGECGGLAIERTKEDVEAHMQELVDRGLAEWREQGGETEEARGCATRLCVPKDVPDAGAFYEPRAESRYERRA